MKIDLPPNFNKRYTLDHLIPRKALTDGKLISEIEKDVARIMKVGTTRMVRIYRTESEDSKRREISEEIKSELGAYFGIPADYILTIKVIPLDNAPLTATNALG